MMDDQSVKSVVADVIDIVVVCSYGSRWFVEVFRKASYNIKWPIGHHEVERNKIPVHVIKSEDRKIAIGCSNNNNNMWGKRKSVLESLVSFRVSTVRDSKCDQVLIENGEQLAVEK